MMQLPNHQSGCPDTTEWQMPAVMLWQARFNDFLCITMLRDHIGYVRYNMDGPGGYRLESDHVFSDDVTTQARQANYLQNNYKYVWGSAEVRGMDPVAASCGTCLTVSLVGETKALSDRARDYLRDLIEQQQ